MKILHSLIILLSIFSCSQNKVTKRNADPLPIQSQNSGVVSLNGDEYQRTVISGFDRPVDFIKAAKNNFLVDEFNSRRIIKLNSNYEFVKWIGPHSDGSFTQEWDDIQNINNHASVPDVYSEPHSFVIDSRTPNEFLVMFYGRGTRTYDNTIARFDIDKGNFLGSFGLISETEFSEGFTMNPKIGKGKNLFHGIANAIYDRSYNLFAEDYVNCSIVKFDTNLKLVGWIGGKSTTETTNTWEKVGSPVCSDIPGAFKGPHNLAFDSADNIYIADTWNDRIQKFSPQGKLIGWIGAKSNGNLTQGWETDGKAIASNKLGAFDKPVAIRIDNKDHLYVLEWAGNRLQKLNLNGEPIWNINGYNAPYGLRVTSEDEFIVADTGNKQVIIYKK